MLPEQFVEEVGKKARNYHVYLTSDCETNELQSILEEIKTSLEEIRKNYETYELAQSKLRPNVPFHMVVDELELCELGLQERIANRNRPRYQP